MAIRPFKQHFAARLAEHVALPPADVERMIEYPPDAAMGDLAFPCFTLAKTLRKAPPVIAKDVAALLAPDDVIASAAAVGPYVNVVLDRARLARAVLGEVLRAPGRFAAGEPCGKKLVVDYSSPNIAKYFHIGHLRSTIIGNSLRLIHRHLGWEVIGINHLGDWGTQFGKLIVAFGRWGDEARLGGQDPVAYLEELYVRYHKELEAHPEFEDEARAAFKRLEDGGAAERALWTRFRDMSLKKFREVYELLGIEFDHYTGESFYEDKMEPVVQRLREAGLAVESQGALIVDLEPHGMPACLLRKKDGASLYATRDLAAGVYRVETFDPTLVLYVHGQPQDLHFRQWFKVLELLDAKYKDRFAFAGFGQYRFLDKKFSTREGNVIHLDDVIDECRKRVREVLDASKAGGRELADPEAVERVVAIGGLLFGDLGNDRVKDINFEWDRIVKPDGDTGPYIQYAHARCRSLLRKAGAAATTDLDAGLLTEPEEASLLLWMARLPEVLEQARVQLKPHQVANHVLELAKQFSKYYHSHPGILKQEPGLQRARLALTAAVAEVVKLELGLLGIPAPDEM